MPTLEPPVSRLVTAYPDYAERFAGLNDLSDGYLSFFEHFARGTTHGIELGCGSGRILVALAALGHAVDGLERDATMVTAARRALDERGIAKCAIFSGDFRDPLPGRYDLVYFSNDTFAMLPDPADRARVFASVSEGIATGGRFVLPLTHPAEYLESAVTRISRGGALTGGGSIELEEVRINDLLLGQRIGFKSETIVRDGRRETRATIRPLAMVLPAEIEILAARYGFATEALFGDFDRSPLRADSRRYIWVGRRR